MVCCWGSVANTSTPVPGTQNDTFTSFGGFSCADSKVAFHVIGPNGEGVYFPWCSSPASVIASERG